MLRGWLNRETYAVLDGSVLEIFLVREGQQSAHAAQHPTRFYVPIMDGIEIMDSRMLGMRVSRLAATFVNGNSVQICEVEDDSRPFAAELVDSIAAQLG